MYKLYCILTIIILHSTYAFTQNTSATCTCNATNIIATGHIAYTHAKVYSPTLTTYNYESNVMLTNNTNCYMFIKSASIGNKTTYLNLSIRPIANKQRSWISSISHTSRLVVLKDGKALVTFAYSLNGKACKQSVMLAIK